MQAFFFAASGQAPTPVAADAGQIKAALTRAAALVSRSPEQARQLAREMILPATRLQNKSLEAEAYSLVGLVEYYQGRYDSASRYFNKSLGLLRPAGLANQADQVIIQLAMVEGSKANYNKALGLLLPALARQEKEGTPEIKASVLSELGKLYDQMKQPEMALDYLQSAQALFNQSEYSTKAAINDTNIGNVYIAQEKYELAGTHYHKALAFFEKEQDLRRMAHCYTNLAIILQKQSQPDKALTLYKKALAVNQRLGNIEGQMNAFNNLGLIYDVDMRQPDKALPYFLKAYQLAKQSRNRETEFIIVANLYWLHKDQNQLASAIMFLERYAELQDSLVNETRVRQIAELQEKYEADRRLRQIAQLKSDNLLKEANASRRTWERNVSIACGLLLACLALLLVRHYRQKQRSAQLLAAKNKELNKRHVQELLRKQEVATLHAHLDGQEAERKRIAQDLHDRLGGLLATIKLYFQVARTPEQIEKTNELLDTACQEVRQIAHNMASGVLTKFGLVAALKSLADSITQSGQLQMHTNFYGLDNRLDSKVEITLYRVVQELVSNTLRHAQATEVTLQLTRRKSSLSLIVEDNGRGFSADKITPGMGLESIGLRVEQLNGKLSVDSGLGSGTTVVIEIPLPKARPVAVSVSHKTAPV